MNERRAPTFSLSLSLSSDVDPPVSKKPRTTSVLVEQAGQSDKVLIDQVANSDSIFEEVRVHELVIKV